MAITSAISGLMALMLGSFAGLRLIVSIGLAIAVGILIFNINVIPVGVIVIAGIALIPMLKSFFDKTGVYSDIAENNEPPLDDELLQQMRLKADRGDVQTQFKLGVIFNTGQGVAQDYKEAIKWMRISADQGLAEAQHFLGLMYVNGDGVPRDNNEAIKWCLLSAEQGNPDAQNLLGHLYGERIGPEALKESVKWYMLATDQGSSSAPCSLAMMYEHGLGAAPQDYEEAAKWYRLAAERGDFIAQSSLSTLYADGKGVPQDIISAHMWSNVAALQGYEDAKIDRDELEMKMTSEQIEQAQKQAAEFQADLAGSLGALVT